MIARVCHNSYPHTLLGNKVCSVGDHNSWHCCAEVETSLIIQFQFRSGSDLKFIFVLRCHSTEQDCINKRIQTHVGQIVYILCNSCRSLSDSMQSRFLSEVCKWYCMLYVDVRNNCKWDCLKPCQLLLAI